jgi:glycerophosphoryl diester phosphodiesterase
MEMGADGFELDVHLSKDGELVVIHDETVDRTTDGTGLVRDLTLEQLKKLDASNGMAAYQGAKIPTLGEVFDLVRDTRHIVNVEIKTDEWFYPQIEEKCLALASEKGVEDRVIYSSFNHHTLLKMRQLKPDAKLGMLFGDIMVNPWEYAEQLSVDYLHPMKMNIYVPGFAAGTRNAGYGINMWTINDAETMLECMKHNAGIITNFPDIAVALKNA